jgi:hypothetical protein
MTRGSANMIMMDNEGNIYDLFGVALMARPPAVS